MSSTVVDLGHEAVLAPVCVGFDVEVADAHRDVEFRHWQPLLSQPVGEVLLGVASEEARRFVGVLDRLAQASCASVAGMVRKTSTKGGQCGLSAVDRFA